jgi:hypothetical protein
MRADEEPNHGVAVQNTHHAIVVIHACRPVVADFFEMEGMGVVDFGARADVAFRRCAECGPEAGEKRPRSFLTALLRIGRERFACPRPMFGDCPRRNFVELTRSGVAFELSVPLTVETTLNAFAQTKEFVSREFGDGLLDFLSAHKSRLARLAGVFKASE